MADQRLHGTSAAPDAEGQAFDDALQAAIDNADVSMVARLLARVPAEAGPSCEPWERADDAASWNPGTPADLDTEAGA